MKLNIGYVFDDGFAECSAVSMMSIIENHKFVDDIKFWVMDDGISENSKTKITDMVSQKGRNIQFVDATALSRKFEQLGVEPWRGRYSAYMKLFVSEFHLSRDVERLLIIDGDTIINGDITELFTMDLCGHPCAMGLECVPGDYYFASGLGKSELYNAGVIVYDVAQWDKYSVEKRVLDYIGKNGGHYMLPEEDIISRILKGNIQILPPKYNFLTLFDIYNTNKYFKRLRWDELDNHFYTVDIIRDARNDIRIFHCIDSCTNRPWHRNNCHPCAGIYDKYRMLTPWCDEEKAKNHMSLWHKGMYLCRRYLPLLLSKYFFYLTNKYSYSRRAIKFYSK